MAFASSTVQNQTRDAVYVRQGNGTSLDFVAIL